MPAIPLGFSPIASEFWPLYLPVPGAVRLSTFQYTAPLQYTPLFRGVPGKLNSFVFCGTGTGVVSSR